VTYLSISITIKRAPRLPMLSSCASFFDMEPYRFEPLRLDKARSVKIRQPPEACARTIFVHRFNIGVALSRPRLRANTSDRNASDARSPCRMLFFAAFLKVHNELHGAPRIASQRESGGLRP
jgi:hypothetical protein